MRSSLRSIAVLAIVLVAGLPAGRAACEILCAPGGDARAPEVAPAGEHHAASCHDSTDPVAPALAGTPTHACGDHRPVEIAVSLKAGRIETGARPIDTQVPPGTFARSVVPAPVPLASTPPLSERSSSTLTSLASVVLRI